MQIITVKKDYCTSFFVIFQTQKCIFIIQIWCKYSSLHQCYTVSIAQQSSHLPMVLQVVVEILVGTQLVNLGPTVEHLLVDDAAMLQVELAVAQQDDQRTYTIANMLSTSVTCCEV